MIELDDDFFKICCHELAHAYTARYFGVCDTAKIRVDGGLRGSGRTSIAAPQNPVALMAVLMAGEIAEQLIFGRAEGCTDDRAKLAECLHRIGWDADDERIAILRRMTKRIVKLGLSEITRTAAQLTEPGNFTLHWRAGAIQ